jgi:hypothetical protein
MAVSIITPIATVTPSCNMKRIGDDASAAKVPARIIPQARMMKPVAMAAVFTPSEVPLFQILP